MGHDITSYKGTKDTDSEELAYMRRGAFNNLNSTVYKALDADDCNCGVSGCGVKRTFTKEQLEAGLKKIPDGDLYSVEREFISETLKKCGDGPATIFFG